MAHLGSMEPEPTPPTPFPIRVFAPDAAKVTIIHRSDNEEVSVDAIGESSGHWSAEIVAVDGDVYWIEVDGSGPLLDPSARRVVATVDGFRSAVRHRWPTRPSLGQHVDQPVIYEAHVRGFGGGFDGTADRLDHLVSLGVQVLELMPVHPFDPAANYWGYMPLVWGAVHEQFSRSDEDDDGRDAADQLADLIDAAHERGLEVWLDVVFNHTGEGDASLPTLSLRGLANRTSYRHHPDGSYIDNSGCGNDIDPADPEIRRLILEALDRFADLGFDGFRFDLASLLTRDDGGLVAMISEWAANRDIRLIAEPWDMGAYQLGGSQWPENWMQWNDRFRDDVRGFVRGEPGLVSAMMQRIAGSPDLFSQPAQSLNFITAHDGLTMHDLTMVTSDRHRSWDCGDELRTQQLKNYFTMLLLAKGCAMFVMGDECGRTQGGNDNPYNVDSPLTWMDWPRCSEWSSLNQYVQQLIGLRNRHIAAPVSFFGATGPVDVGHDSRSLAWRLGGLVVLANMWWQPVTFTSQQPGDWRVVLSSSQHDPAVGQLEGVSDLTVAARSVVVLELANGKR